MMSRGEFFCGRSWALALQELLDQGTKFTFQQVNAPINYVLMIHVDLASCGTEAEVG